jgi:hypothetical protein
MCAMIGWSASSIIFPRLYLFFIYTFHFMLHPASPLPSPQPHSCQRSSSIRRRRGAQPGNSNALRHGLYSNRTSRPPAGLFQMSPDTRVDPIISPDHKRRWIAALDLLIKENRLRLLEVAEIDASCLGFAERASWLLLVTSLVGVNVRAARALHKLGGRQEHLHSLVRNLPALLRWESHRRGFPVHPPFVPRKLNNLHAYSGWKPRRLTESQWQLLQGVILSLPSGRTSSRGRHRSLLATRLLLEGILWKLANSLPWHALRGIFPVRACQDLYRTLCCTGYMQVIYQQLRWHLDHYGGATLSRLVGQGCFEISGNRVLLSSSEQPTWEKFTALLLLQQAYHNRRAIQRSMDMDRRLQGAFFRLPPLRYRSFTRRTSVRSPKPQAFPVDFTHSAGSAIHHPRSTLPSRTQVQPSIPGSHPLLAPAVESQPACAAFNCPRFSVSAPRSPPLAVTAPRPAYSAFSILGCRRFLPGLFHLPGLPNIF